MPKQTPAREQTVDTVEAADVIAGLRGAAHERLADLRQRRNELSLDAIMDSSAKPDLEAIETEIGDAERELQRLGFAAAEHERRELIRLSEEEYQRKRAALVQAGELADERAEAASAFDRAADAFVDAAATYNRIAREMGLAIRQAGQQAGAEVAMPNGLLLKLAFGQATYDRFEALQGLDWFDQFGYVAGHQVERLVDSDPVAQVGIELYIERLDAAHEAPTAQEEAQCPR